MISIRELSSALHMSMLQEDELIALKKKYNKLTRVLHCILKEHSGILSDEDWMAINSSEEGINYSYSVNDNDHVIIESHAKLHTT